MGIQEHHSKVRLRNKVNVGMNGGCIVQCSKHITMAHCVEWHRVWNSKTQKQCNTSQYNMIQHETRQNRKEQNKIQQNGIEEKRIEHSKTKWYKVWQIRPDKSRTRENGSVQPFFFQSTLMLNTSCMSKIPARSTVWYKDTIWDIKYERSATFEVADGPIMMSATWPHSRSGRPRHTRMRAFIHIDTVGC